MQKIRKKTFAVTTLRAHRSRTAHLSRRVM